MGKLREAWNVIMKDYDWKRFIIGLSVCLAIMCFVLGALLAILFANIAYLFLWVFTMVSIAFAMGVEVY